MQMSASPTGLGNKIEIGSKEMARELTHVWRRSGEPMYFPPPPFIRGRGRVKLKALWPLATLGRTRRVNACLRVFALQLVATHFYHGSPRALHPWTGMPWSGEEETLLWDRTKIYSPSNFPELDLNTWERLYCAPKPRGRNSFSSC